MTKVTLVVKNVTSVLTQETVLSNSNVVRLFGLQFNKFTCHPLWKLERLVILFNKIVETT